MFNRIDLENIISGIISDIEREHSKLNATGLYGGSTGVALFLYNAVKHGFSKETDLLYKLLSQSVSVCNSKSAGYSLSSGLAGEVWFLKYLVCEGVVKKEDWFDLIQEIQKNYTNFQHSAVNYNYDSLHGSIGIANSLLYTQTGSDLNIFHFKLCNTLLELKELSAFKMVPHFDAGSRTLVNSTVNLGLAHGLAGILKYYLNCFINDINKQVSYDEAYNIINFYKCVYGRHTHQMFSFPHTLVYNAKQKSEYSRLAWCYGDLGIGLILLQAGYCFGDSSLVEFSNEILMKTTLRKNYNETGVVDSGICHGSAGIAYLYYKIWKITSNSAYLDACNYWIESTVNNAFGNDVSIKFARYNNFSKSYEHDISLLEGSSGIGLLMISYLTGDCSWDYCITLN